MFFQTHLRQLVETELALFRQRPASLLLVVKVMQNHLPGTHSHYDMK